MIRAAYMLLNSAVLSISLATSTVFAGRFDSDDPAKTPLSVPLDQIATRINNDPSADGIQLSFKQTNGNLHIDLIAIPGNTSVAAATRVVFMTGRLAEPDYLEMMFDDGGTTVFKIDGNVIREIGSEFVWGEEGKGQNPIALIRKFMDNLRTADGRRVAEPMTGSLMGDTSRAMRAMNERFTKEWTVGTAKVLPDR